MKTYFGRYMALTVCITLLFCAVFPLTAAAAGEMDDISLDHAKAVYLYNIENEQVILEKAPDVSVPPASTVKIMTGLLAAEKLGGRLDEKVKITDQLLSGFVSGSRSVGLYAGQTPTIRDLLYLSFCGSYNDAIAVLVNLISGNELAFVSLMNQRAAELGMSNTKYTNATGVHSDMMYTTAADVAKLSLAASKSSLLMTVTEEAKYKTEGLAKQFTVDNYNYLMVNSRYFNSACRGLNAGSTPTAGYSVVTISELKGLSYLCIVMGADEDQNGNIYSYIIANKLINAAYDRYGYVNILSSSTVICDLPVSMSLDISSVLIIPERDISAYLPLSLVIGKDITYDYRLTVESLEAPVSEATQVGFITVYRGDQQLATTALVTKSAVGKSELLSGLEKIRAFSQSRFFIATVIIAASLTLLYIIAKAIYRAYEADRRPRRRR